uniref:C3H1-type domain-containing protein n=1 Tax=Solanum lycopersicum TaxID=4081 RepID=A0A3Q7GY41_SOLLC
MRHDYPHLVKKKREFPLGRESKEYPSLDKAAVAVAVAAGPFVSENPRYDYHQNRSPPRVSSNITLNQPPYQLPHPHPSSFHYNDHYHKPPPPPPPRFIVTDFTSSGLRENRASSVNDSQEPLRIRRDVNSKYDDDERYRLERRRMEIDIKPWRDFRKSPGNYDVRVDRYEGERWEYGDNVDEVLVGSSSRRVSSLDNGNDCTDVRFSNRLRVDKEEIHRSPQKKQVQKKSALLRIQCGKANNRSRNQDYDLSSGAVRGKQKDVFERLEKRVEEREGSQMELDVSFKSNALVAKAIMTPSSSAIDSDRSEAPRCKKIRKVNFSGSPTKRIGDDSGKGYGSANDSGFRPSSNQEFNCLADKITVSAVGSSSNCTLDSYKDSRHLADKSTDSIDGRTSNGTLNNNKESQLLPDEATVSVASRASNSTSLLSSTVTNDLTGTKESKESAENKVLNQGSNHVEKFRLPFFIIRKKKVPKKKVINPINVKLPSDEVVSKLEKPFKLSAVSKDESLEQSNSDGKKASPAKVLVSSSMDSEIYGVADYTSRSVQSVPSTMNFETCMIEVQNEPTSSDLDNTGHVGGHSEDELRVSEDGPIKESSESMACEERNGDAVLSSLDGREIHKDEVSSSTEDTYISADSGLGFSDGKKNAVAVIGSFGAGCVEPSSDSNVVPLLNNIENGLRESFFNANDSCSNSDETGRTAVDNDLQTADCLSNSDPRAGTFGGSFESCVDGLTLSPEMRHTKGSINAGVSVGDDVRIIVDDDCLPKVTRKRKIMDDESVMPTTKMSKTEENVVSSLLGQGNNFSCFREDRASEEEDGTVSGYGTDSLKGDHSYGGPSEVELSLQDCFKDDSESCSTKRAKKSEVSSPAKVKSAPCVTTYEEPSSRPITMPMINDVSVTELESPNTLTNVDDSPLARPSVNVLESSSIAKGVCQAEPFEHFSDDQQVVAHNSQLGAVGQETTTSVVSIETLKMADRVSDDQGSSVGIDQKLAPESHESCHYVLDRDDMPLLADNLSLFANKVSVKSMESVPDMSPLLSFPDLTNCSVSEEPIDKSSVSSEIVIEKALRVDENSRTAYDNISSSVKTSSDAFEFDRSSDHKVGGNPVVNINTVALSSQNTVKSSKNVSSQGWKPNLGANQQIPAGSRVLSVRPSSFITPRNVPVPKKPLTWHRTGNSFSSVVGRGSQMNSLPPQSHLSKDTAKVGSYIRKGNSLVRNPSPVGSLPKGYHASSSSTYRLNSSGVNDLRRKCENRAEITGSPSCRGTPEVNAPSERPKTPTQSESFSCVTLMSTSSPVVDHPGNGDIATNSDPMEVTDNILALKPSELPSTSSAVLECQIGLGGDSGSQNTLDEGSSRKVIVYVKQRSNQLVAASDKTQTSSDGYYKRRKNQLIRASGNNQMKQRVATTKNIVPFQRGMKRLNGLAKTSKLSKFSLVWKLGDTQSSRKYGGTVEYEKLWPFLFPWKRASYRRNFLSSSPSDNSSIIRRKLLLSKKRETIYTRSIHGLSLRRSKVLSVSGSSLKWSKSIEQRSKKAAEEAALAVAAVDKRRRGQYGSNADSMNGNNVSRKFYSVKLLPGRPVLYPGEKGYSALVVSGIRWTLLGRHYTEFQEVLRGLNLVRQCVVGDEEPSVSVPEAKKSYVPKRLLIGNDEYVRVGNGNKLVRNPKRRVRILASEKVRWSLHTARIRLARKKQYCQFFTRFGKCNKDSGKCPYIHDPSKIAVCSKFLNGSCSDTNCKLTHEVIPERMQDCSYFLQGICSNENCPYRHVNVNPNASICEGFLRGYCADGNECQKKHTYVCPVFEATGNCPKGSNCKLHHPKNRRKGAKRKALSELKNGRGRYFGSPHIHISECITAGSEKPSVKGNNDIFLEGKFVDFISLDGSDEEEQTIDQRSEEKPLCESGPAEMQLDDLDELIKPVRLINRNRSVGSSPYIDSPSDMTTSYVSE